jgi:hypothetical protein
MRCFSLRVCVNRTLPPQIVFQAQPPPASKSDASGNRARSVRISLLIVCAFTHCTNSRYIRQFHSHNPLQFAAELKGGIIRLPLMGQGLVLFGSSGGATSEVGSSF